MTDTTWIPPICKIDHPLFRKLLSATDKDKLINLFLFCPTPAVAAHVTQVTGASCTFCGAACLNVVPSQRIRQEKSLDCIDRLYLKDGHNTNEDT